MSMISVSLRAGVSRDEQIAPKEVVPINKNSIEVKTSLEPLGWELREIIKTRSLYENPHKLLKYFNLLLSNNLGVNYEREAKLIKKHEIPFQNPTQKAADARLETKLNYLHIQIYSIIRLIQTELLSAYDNRIRLGRLESKAAKDKRADTKTAVEYLAAHEKEDGVRKRLDSMILDLDFSGMTDDEIIRFVIGKDPGGLDRIGINKFYLDLFDAL